MLISYAKVFPPILYMNFYHRQLGKCYTRLEIKIYRFYGLGCMHITSFYSVFLLRMNDIKTLHSSLGHGIFET
jgi:hypothetical protein